MRKGSASIGEHLDSASSFARRRLPFHNSRRYQRSFPLICSQDLDARMQCVGELVFALGSETNSWRFHFLAPLAYIGHRILFGIDSAICIQCVGFLFLNKVARPTHGGFIFLAERAGLEVTVLPRGPPWCVEDRWTGGADHRPTEYQLRNGPGGRARAPRSGLAQGEGRKRVRRSACQSGAYKPGWRRIAGSAVDGSEQAC